MDVLKPPMQISFITSNVAENWRCFERQFRVYYAACELQLKSKATQVGILLRTAGAEAQDVHDTFDYDGDEDKDDFELVLTKLHTYCEPRKNIVFSNTRCAHAEKRESSWENISQAYVTSDR